MAAWGCSTIAFVDDLAIVAHVRTSTDLHAGVSFVYDALPTAAAKRGLSLIMKRRKAEVAPLLLDRGAKDVRTVIAKPNGTISVRGGVE
eukprot:12120011-Karenia_brevis.AAC.1